MRVSLPKTAEIRTIPKSLPRSFQNNFKCLFFKRLYQIDEILKYDSAYFSKGNLQKSKYGTFYYCDTTISKKIPQYLKKRIVLLQKQLLNISSQKHSINLEGNRFQIYVEDKWIGDINRDSVTREIEEIQSVLQIINNSSDIKNKL